MAERERERERRDLRKRWDPMEVPVPAVEDRIVDRSAGEVEAEVMPMELGNDAAPAQLLAVTEAAEGGKEEAPSRRWWR